MTQVLVLEFDEAIRGCLREILATQNHYDVVEVESETDALAYLGAHEAGMVVICSNRDADHHLTTAFFTRVVADADLSRRHRYLLLSTNPATMPLALQASLAQLGTAALPKPFDVDALLTGVREAAEQLAMCQLQAGVSRVESLPKNAS